MTTAAVTPPPRIYVASWAARTGQRVNARIIDLAVSAVVVLTVLALGPHGRPFAQDLIILSVVTMIETVSITTRGATVGMRVVGLRVQPIGRTGFPSWLAAFRRSVPVAMCSMVLLPGTFVALVMPIVLLTSVSLSPLRQAFHDRLSDTLVVTDGAPGHITTSMLELWWDPSRGVTMTPWGRAPDLHERRRARSHRLDGAWWLAAPIVIATVMTARQPHSLRLLASLAIVWMMLFIYDETVRIHRIGTTPGHAALGFRIVDIDTGANPSLGRAFVRSLVLAPLLYIPPLQLLLALWVQASSRNRGPHDLVGRTVVVEPDFVPPRLDVPPLPVWTPGVSAPFSPSTTYGWVPPPPPVPPRWAPPPPPPPPRPLPPQPPADGSPPLGAF